MRWSWKIREKFDSFKSGIGRVLDVLNLPRAKLLTLAANFSHGGKFLPKEVRMRQCGGHSVPQFHSVPQCGGRDLANSLQTTRIPQVWSRVAQMSHLWLDLSQLKESWANHNPINFVGHKDNPHLIGLKDWFRDFDLSLRAINGVFGLLWVTCNNQNEQSCQIISDHTLIVSHFDYFFLYWTTLTAILGFWMILFTCWSGTASLSLHLLLGTCTGLPGALSSRSSPPGLSLPKLPPVSPPQPPLLSFARARSSKFLTESNLQKISLEL